MKLINLPTPVKISSLCSTNCGYFSASWTNFTPKTMKFFVVSVTDEVLDIPPHYSQRDFTLVYGFPLSQPFTQFGLTECLIPSYMSFVNESARNLSEALEVYKMRALIQEDVTLDSYPVLDITFAQRQNGGNVKYFANEFAACSLPTEFEPFFNQMVNFGFSVPESIVAARSKKSITGEVNF